MLAQSSGYKNTDLELSYLKLIRLCSFLFLIRAVNLKIAITYYIMLFVKS